MLAQKVRESEHARKAAVRRGPVRVSGRVGVPFPRAGGGGSAYLCGSRTRHAAHLRGVLCLGVCGIRPPASLCLHPQVCAACACMNWLRCQYILFGFLAIYGGYFCRLVLIFHLFRLLAWSIATHIFAGKLKPLQLRVGRCPAPCSLWPHFNRHERRQFNGAGLRGAQKRLGRVDPLARAAGAPHRGLPRLLERGV